VRTVLVPLIVRSPYEDDRTPQELAQAIVDALALDPEVVDCEVSALAAREGGAENWVIVFTPEPTREYGDPEVVGTFPAEDEAKAHLRDYVEPSGGWQATVVRVDDPTRSQDEEER